ncbi:hypothetical protein [Alloactinosynnema sp. L-07]|uniref:hypothetical protein n=1 Tax=Alloactinosynnema sp. L-07 TaxID=1653480 RepID=UPI00065F093B|nr:hypothetical protein [Alloactinosynnema sp. L-07]CRK57090.1 hypothetical protein [Alloactinosynnema sp. L-07]
MLTRASRSGKADVTLAANATRRVLWRADAVLCLGVDPTVWIDRALTDFRAGLTIAAPAVDAAITVRFGIGVDELVERLVDPEHGLTAHGSRFSTHDAAAAVADALPFGASLGEVEILTAAALAHPAVISLAQGDLVARATGRPGSSPASGELHTTADVPHAELSDRRLDAAITAADTALTTATTGHAETIARRDEHQAALDTGRGPAEQAVDYRLAALQASASALAARADAQAAVDVARRDYQRHMRGIAALQTTQPAAA